MALRNVGGVLVSNPNSRLNDSLSALASVLGEGIGRYNRPPVEEPEIPLPDRFKLIKDMKDYGLTNDQINSYSTDDLNNIQKYREGFTQTNNPAEALGNALKEFEAVQQQQETQAQQEQFNALSPFEKFRSTVFKDASMFGAPGKDSSESASALMQALGQNPQNLAQSSPLLSLLTGNAYSNNRSTPDNDSLIGALTKGASSGLGGQIRAADQKESFEDFKARTQLKGSNPIKKLVYQLGQVAADLPFSGPSIAAGASLGSALGAPLGPVGATVGGVVGGGALGQAIPELLRSGLDEYMQYTDKGGKGTFGDFLKSASNVTSRTASAFNSGALLGIVSKFKLDKVPAIQKLLSLKGGKVAKEFIETAAQAGIVSTTKSVAKGEFPSVEQYEKDLTNLLGFRLFNAGSNKFKEFYTNMKKAGVSPEQAAQNINQVAPTAAPSQRQAALAQVRQQQALQQAPMQSSVPPVQMNQPLQQANAIQVQPQPVMERQLPVTKARSIKTPAPVKEQIKKVQGTEKSVFNPNQNAQSISEISRNIGNRPVKEYIDFEIDKAAKEANLTPAAQAKRDLARETSSELSKDLKIIKSNLDDLNENMKIQGLSSQVKKSYATKKAELESQIQTIERSIKEANDIARTGQKRQTQQETEAAADKRIVRLLEDALNPKSITGTKTTDELARDEKYVNDLATIVDKGEIPIKKVSDFGIRQLETYQEKYLEQLKKINENLQTAPKSEVANLTAQKNLIEKNLRVNDAKIQLRKDKANVLANLEGAKGALVKQHLKDLRKDIESFQRDFVKVSKVQSAIEAKTQKAAMARLATEKGQKALEKALEEGNLQEASNMTTIPLNDLKSILKDTNRHGELIIKAIQKEQENKASGDTPGAEVKSAYKAFTDYLNGLNLMPKTFAKNAIGLAIRLAAKRFLGVNLPNRRSGIAAILGGGGGLLSLISAANRAITRVSTEKENKAYAKSLKQAKSSSERERIYREMTSKGFAPKRRKQIEALRYAS